MQLKDNPELTALVISIGVAVFKGIKELIRARIGHRRELARLLDEVFEAAAQYTYDTYIREWKRSNPHSVLPNPVIMEAQSRTYKMADQIAQAQGISLRSLGHPRLVQRRIERAVRILKRRASKEGIAP